MRTNLDTYVVAVLVLVVKRHDIFDDWCKAGNNQQKYEKQTNNDL